ncbi:efflux RND transporter periplasmic adaptor subunit [Myxococcus qinghaiensis]|uniref:efflux RND transporter periplasmic adaptor subunit n=1 Tax=Myxococcus qinghaiensis TaxID=2906758 RepID=UPI0020A799B5|nr:efflux RND transporter periplasmic adaptor subunit [Myxococcus qinghaiensis]
MSTRRSDSLVGVIFARQALDVVVDKDGRLLQLKHQLGERVEAGQVVAVLDTKTRQLEVAMRQATLNAATAEQSRYAVLLTQARQKLERESQIRAFSAAEAMETAETQVELALADLELARSRVAEARAQLALAQQGLEDASIRAPFSGSVSDQYLQPGMLVSRATPILRLVSDELRLRFFAPSGIADVLQVGVEVRVWIEGTDTPLVGVVDRLSPEIDASSRQQKLEARLLIPEALRKRVRVGQIVQVEPGPTHGHAGQLLAPPP